MHTRPQALTIGVVLLALLSLLNFISPLLPTDYPTIVLLLGGTFGVVGLLAAAGLWMLRRWALLLTLIVSVLNLVVVGSWDSRRAARHGQTPRRGYDRRLHPYHCARDAGELAACFRGHLSLREGPNSRHRPRPSHWRACVRCHVRSNYRECWLGCCAILCQRASPRTLQHRTTSANTEQGDKSMHAVVAVFNLDRAWNEEHRRTVEEQLIPITRQVPGFVSCYWMSDPEEPTAVLVKVDPLD